MTLGQINIAARVVSISTVVNSGKLGLVISVDKNGQLLTFRVADGSQQNKQTLAAVLGMAALLEAGLARGVSVQVEYNDVNAAIATGVGLPASAFSKSGEAAADRIPNPVTGPVWSAHCSDRNGGHGAGIATNIVFGNSTVRCAKTEKQIDGDTISKWAMQLGLAYTIGASVTVGYTQQGDALEITSLKVG